jgi:hypothetical protein
MRAKHANNGATLTVSNRIEYLANTQRIPDWDFNRMRGPQRVKLEGLLNALGLRICQPCSMPGIPLDFLRTTNCAQTFHSAGLNVSKESWVREEWNITWI